MKEYKFMYEASGWNEAEILNRFPAYLTGLALRVYKDIEDSKKKTWKDLARAFVQEITLDDMNEYHINALKNRRQGENESILEYASGLKELAKRALINDQDKIFRLFKRGL